ncbi:MAG: acyltransferase [Tannerella sp.]|jgi:peptidoglycan/LPS O-acetylase OafA/YrhL|nr:acyltransferase [Tannerella sp.]
MSDTQQPVPQKNYYDVLDGLRGTAAIVILIFHYLEMTYPDDYEHNPLGHGFLAVDFFFCLSGFVIGFAYDHRIRTIGMRQFFINRLIRLHPMVVMGTLIGLIGYVADPFLTGTEAFNPLLLVVAVLGASLLIPTPFLPYRQNGLFPFNTPSWSLFFEYLANILYAILLSRSGKRLLVFLGIISAGWLTFTSYRAGWLIGGWDSLTWTDALPRVCCSFITGLMVFRFRLSLKNKFGFVLPFLLLMGVFMFPHVKNDWYTEAILVILVFPFIMMVGSGATVKGFMRKCCLFIGRLSYPLYMTHITTVWIFGNYYTKYNPAGLQLYATVSGLIVFNLLSAYLIMKFYDEPLRRWLTARKWKVES